MPETAGAPSTPAAQAAAARLAGMRPPGRVVPGPGTGDAAASGAPGTTAEAPKAEKKKRKLPIKLIALVLVVLVAGYVVKGKVMKPHYGPGHPAPAGEVLSLGTVTTNLSDGHLAQVSISLQLSKPANEKTVTKDEPELTATVVSELGQQTYPGLLDPVGRAALRQALLRSFQQELGTAEGAQSVTAVYFTGFVLQ